MSFRRKPKHISVRTDVGRTKREVVSLAAGNCDVTGKYKYLDEASASRANKMIRKRTKAKMKVYRCVYCQGYHVGHWRKPHLRHPGPKRKRVDNLPEKS